MIWALPAMTSLPGWIILVGKLWREIAILVLLLITLFQRATVVRLQADAYAVQIVQEAAADRHEAAMDGAVAEGVEIRKTAQERAAAAVEDIGRAESCEEVLAALLEGTRVVP